MPDNELKGRLEEICDSCSRIERALSFLKDCLKDLSNSDIGNIQTSVMPGMVKARVEYQNKIRELTKNPDYCATKCRYLVTNLALITSQSQSEG